MPSLLRRNAQSVAARRRSATLVSGCGQRLSLAATAAGCRFLHPKDTMSGSRQQSLVDARRLMRTFASAPDARRRAQAVISELRHGEGWAPAAQQAIAATDTWLSTSPPLTA